MVWKLAQSPKVTDIFAAPGNAGTAQSAHNLDIKATDIEALAAAAQDIGADLVVVGPEAPLAAGIVDSFKQLGIPIFGASKLAAEIESSKVFARELMQKYGIPGAQGVTFSEYAPARDYIRRQTPLAVVQFDQRDAPARLLDRRP